jgi:alkanesulfonate monooxygenase SsuD/methylene tetrahydromethanopterin reductase-like flavin-dependent oxidoreductase (luciferase family)
MIDVVSSGVESSRMVRTRMKVGLYFDLRNPHGWRQDPARLHAFTLEAIEEAEHLGADSVWLSEHHLFADDYVAAPLTFLAAAAARTSRVRLGTAVVLAPLHHAVEIAEQAAMVDLISGGRLELGLGSGYRVPEYQLYRADLRRRYAQTDAKAAEIRRLLSPGGVLPQPVQPHLPIWMGYQGPKGARRAGLLGERLLSADARNWPSYRDGLTAAGHSLDCARMAGWINSWVTEDPDADWPTVKIHMAHQFDSYASHGVEGTGQPPPPPVDPEQVRAGTPDALLGYFWCDRPETVAQRIADYTEGAPVETVLIFASLAGMPEQMVARHIHTICTTLAPLLAEVGTPTAGR